MAEKQIQKEKEENTAQIRQYFFDYLEEIKYKGIFGVSDFSSVFNNLMTVQQEKLKSILQTQFADFMKTGSIICIGICIPPEIIDCINVKKDGVADKEKWNIYSKEYERLNNMLKKVSEDISDKFGGIAIPPTIGAEMDNVVEYYPLTISHRVVAEQAGIGWRGKNELIITEKYGPAVRFASILINIPLIYGTKIENKCDECNACLDVCSILKNKKNLENYRQNCNQYILSLDLEHDVCGKCVKACFLNSIFKERFKSN
ncbi:MAG: hypothetical protein ACFFAN_09270 [Promethearchaeota archaeon]